MSEPVVGDALRFGDVFYEVIRVHDGPEGPPKGQIDVGRRGPDDPRDGAGKPIGLALTLDEIVWKDLVALTGPSRQAPG